MCGHKQIGIWEISNITVVDSNDVVNHWLVTGAINKSANSYQRPVLITAGLGRRRNSIRHS